MDYGKILKNTWTTIWTHKVIIWFGFLMMIPTLIMGVIMVGFLFSFNEEAFSSFFNPYASTPEPNPVFIILFFVFFFGFMLLSYVAMGLSFTGVLKGTLELEKREDKISFGQLWELTRPYFWRVFGVFMLAFFTIFIFISVFMLLSSFISLLTMGLGFLCFAPLFLLIIPVEIIAYILVGLAMTAVVAEDLGVFDSFVRAWQIMKQKFWQLVLMAIILFLIQFVLGLIVMVPMQIAQFAFIFSDIANSAPVLGTSTFFKPLSILMLLFIPFASLVQGFGLTYTNAAWMLTYLDITTPQPEEIANLE